MYSPDDAPESPEFSAPLWLHPFCKFFARWCKLCSEVPPLGLVIYIGLMFFVFLMHHLGADFMAVVAVVAAAFALLGLVLGLSCRADSQLPGDPSEAERWMEYWSSQY